MIKNLRWFRNAFAIVNGEIGRGILITQPQFTNPFDLFSRRRVLFQPVVAFAYLANLLAVVAYHAPAFDQLLFQLRANQFAIEVDAFNVE